ncbi:MAG: hypothetical protein WCW87_02165 [Candidatus Paceibacterota bacterium]
MDNTNDDNSTWKLVGEERQGERENALKEGILKSKSFANIKSVISKYRDIINRDTDYKVQNISHMVSELEMKRLSLADMPTQYGIKSKLTEIVSHDTKFNTGMMH